MQQCTGATRQSTRKLARRLEAGTARIMSATVRREGHRWYCAFTAEVHRAQTTLARPDDRVGVDVGTRCRRKLVSWK